jgi:hypothetical protein
MNGGWGVDLLNREIGFVSFVCVCVRVRAERHPLYASIRPGMSFASCGRGRRCGFGVAVGAAVGTDLGAVVGVAVGVDTAASAAVGPPNLPICLRGALDKYCTTQSFSCTGLNAI